MLLALVVALEDQTGYFFIDGFVRTMFPFSAMVRKPLEFSRGLSLLATHTMVLSLMLLYHVPKYQVELVPGKKPRAKTWLGDMRVWLVRRICVEVNVSAENEIVMCCDDAKKKQKRKNKKPGMFGERERGRERVDEVFGEEEK